MALITRTRPPIARAVVSAAEDFSWIRRMFEAGIALKEEHGVENVFDYSLGSPNINRPRSAIAELKRILDDPGKHSYMQQPGFPKVRQQIADHLTEEQGLTTPLTADLLMMTCGAAGAINVVLHSILDPGDDVLTPAPCFVEYQFYTQNHGGNLVPVQTKPDFQLDIKALEEAFTPKTRAIIINYPNNPTAVIYSEESLRQLDELITRKEEEYGHDIYLLVDMPYGRLVFDGAVVPPILKIADKHAIYITSHSKDLGLAGERVGFAALSPSLINPSALFGAMTFSIRTLGFINAPALMQRWVADMQGQMLGLDEYTARRGVLLPALRGMGYEIVDPRGTFYIFPKSPIKDDVKFCKAAMKYNILLVPGSGFEGPGHFRVSYSSIDIPQIERSLDGFQALAREFGL